MVDLTLGILVAAALADSINPCVFGVLIFLCAVMLKMYKKPAHMLVSGLFYTLVVYISYLLIGFGILKLTVSFELSRLFYIFAATIAILAGIIEIKDYFAYGRWFSLQMIPGASKRIDVYINYIKKIQKRHFLLGLLFIGLLGIFVVLVELPCTGAPYLAILALIGQGAYSRAVPLLLLYNLIFILPLFVIIAITYFGTSSRKLEKWRMEYKGLMRLGIGLFLIALGIYMLYSIL